MTLKFGSLAPPAVCVLPLECVDGLWVLLQLGEHMAFFTVLGILEGLKVLDFAPLACCHVLPEKVVLYRASPLVRQLISVIILRQR